MSSSDEAAAATRQSLPSPEPEPALDAPLNAWSITEATAHESDESDEGWARALSPAATSPPAGGGAGGSPAGQSAAGAGASMQLSPAVESAERESRPLPSPRPAAGGVALRVGLFESRSSGSRTPEEAREDDTVFLAAYEGRAGALRRLLEAGDDPDAPFDHPDHGRWSPLHGACFKQRRPAVELLLDHGARADAVDDFRATALHVAAGAGSTGIVDMLLRSPPAVDPNVQDQTGQTPLHMACANGHDTVVSLLIHAGSDLASVDERGDSPLHYSCMYRRERCTAVLLDKGALVDQTGANGATALHAACKEGQAVSAELLLSAGADATLPDAFGRTARVVALSVDKLTCVKVIDAFASKAVKPNDAAAEDGEGEGGFSAVALLETISEASAGQAAKEAEKQRRLFGSSPPIRTGSSSSQQHDNELSPARHQAYAVEDAARALLNSSAALEDDQIKRQAQEALENARRQQRIELEELRQQKRSLLKEKEAGDRRCHELRVLLEETRQLMLSKDEDARLKEQAMVEESFEAKAEGVAKLEVETSKASRYEAEVKRAKDLEEELATTRSELEAARRQGLTEKAAAQAEELAQAQAALKQVEGQLAEAAADLKAIEWKAKEDVRTIQSMTAKRIFDNTNRRNQKKAFEAMEALWRREKTYKLTLKRHSSLVTRRRQRYSIDGWRQFVMLGRQERVTAELEAAKAQQEDGREVSEGAKKLMSAQLKDMARSRRWEDEFIETVFQHWNMYMESQKLAFEAECAAKKKGTQEKKKKSFSRWLALVNLEKEQKQKVKVAERMEKMKHWRKVFSAFRTGVIQQRKMKKAMAKLTNRREAQRFGYWKDLLLRLKRTRKLMKRINSTLIKNAFMGFKESMHRDKLGARRFM